MALFVAINSGGRDRALRVDASGRLLVTLEADPGDGAPARSQLYAVDLAEGDEVAPLRSVDGSLSVLPARYPDGTATAIPLNSAGNVRVSEVASVSRLYLSRENPTGGAGNPSDVRRADGSVLTAADFDLGEDDLDLVIPMSAAGFRAVSVAVRPMDGLGQIATSIAAAPFVPGQAGYEPPSFADGLIVSEPSTLGGDGEWSYLVYDFTSGAGYDPLPMIYPALGLRFEGADGRNAGSFEALILRTP